MFKVSLHGLSNDSFRCVITSEPDGERILKTVELWARIHVLFFYSRGRQSIACWLETCLTNLHADSLHVSLSSKFQTSMQQ